MTKLYSRRFDVDFYQNNEKVWTVISHLVDSSHDITTETQVQVPEMRIIEAKVQFDRYPMDVCPLIEVNVKKIVGLNLLKNYNWKSLTIFLGSKGCGNIMSILGTGLQSFVYTYFPHLVKTGQMSTEAWEKFSIKELHNACLGHTLLEKGKARMMHGESKAG